MRLYYFTSEKYGLENIEKTRLKISTFDKLNDPFELLGFEMSDKTVRNALKFEKSKITKQNGLICFSEDWQDPVQWGHYADSHKGLCLGFDIPDHKLEKVDYVKNRLNSKIYYSKDKQHKLLTTKFEHWGYEKEHRIIYNLGDREQESGLYFEYFSTELVLREVIIGCESKLTQAQIKKKISNTNKKIRIFNARAAFREFKIVWNRSKKSTFT